MNFVELKSTLKSVVKPAYFIHGSDNFLVQKAVELIITAAGVKDAVLDVSKLGGADSAEAIVAACRTVSFFGGPRVVVVRPFTEEQNGIMLKNYLKNPNLDCILLLVGEKPIKDTEEINCNPMQQEILVKLITNQFAAMGKKISSDGAVLLCQYCSNYYSRIDNEINKLVNFYINTDLIGVDEIKAIVTKTQDYQVYELSHAICAGKITQAEEILKILQDSGVEDYAIFGSLVSAFRRLFYSLTCKADNKDVAAMLGCSPFAVQYARRDNKHLTGRIAGLYGYALDLEYQIKSGKISIEDAIVLCYSAV